MKKKILYAITKGNWGGAQKYVFELGLYAKEEGNDVAVLCGEPGVLSQKCEEHGITVYILDSLHRDISFFKEIESFRDILAVLRSERPDVLHVNSSKMGLLGALAGRITRVPKIIFTAHGWPFNEDRPWFSKNVIKVLSWLNVILSHKTIVLSRKERWQMVHWLGAKNKLTVIPIGLKPVAFHTKEEARGIIRGLTQFTHLEEKPDAVWLGTLAELHANKGLSYAIKTLASTTEFPFIFCILGEGEERDSLQKQIDTAGLSKKILLAGFVKEAASLLKAFDVLIFPSIKEGLPYTILEAAYGGLPVIASAVGGIPEVIQNGTNGILVPPKNTAALAKALKELVQNPELQKTLGDNFKKSAEQIYNAEEVFPKTIEVYSDIKRYN